MEHRNEPTLPKSEEELKEIVEATLHLLVPVDYACRAGAAAARSRVIHCSAATANTAAMAMAS
jgi:hypothetical protein